VEGAKEDLEILCSFLHAIDSHKKSRTFNVKFPVSTLVYEGAGSTPAMALKRRA
jgi:hypothetical protein